MTLAEFVSEIQDDLGISTVSDFISSPYIKTQVDRANKWACGYKPWPFMETTATDTTTSSESYDYPSSFLSDSIFLLKVEQDDGTMERYDKINFLDYQKYREDSSSGSDKVFSDFGRKYYINPNPISSATGRTIQLWGLKKADTMSSNTDTTPFSDGEVRGEEAIKKYAESIILSNKLHKLNEANQKFQEATLLLEQIWNSIATRQSSYQTKDRPMFKRIDILEGAVEDDIYDEDKF